MFYSRAKTVMLNFFGKHERFAVFASDKFIGLIGHRAGELFRGWVKVEPRAEDNHFLTRDIDLIGFKVRLHTLEGLGCIAIGLDAFLNLVRRRLLTNTVGNIGHMRKNH